MVTFHEVTYPTVCQKVAPVGNEENLLSREDIDGRDGLVMSLQVSCQ